MDIGTGLASGTRPEDRGHRPGICRPPRRRPIQGQEAPEGLRRMSDLTPIFTGILEALGRPTTKAFDPKEPRDASGRWAAGEGPDGKALRNHVTPTLPAALLEAIGKPPTRSRPIASTSNRSTRTCSPPRRR